MSHQHSVQVTPTLLDVSSAMEARVGSWMSSAERMPPPNAARKPTCGSSGGRPSEALAGGHTRPFDSFKSYSVPQCLPCMLTNVAICSENQSADQGWTHPVAEQESVFQLGEP